MAKQKKFRFKKPEQSPIQWNEGAGEYEMKCGACGKKLYSQDLHMMNKVRKDHTRSKECLGGY